MKIIGVIDVEDKFVSLYDLGFSKDAVLTVLSEYDKLWLHVLLQIKKFYKESGRLYYPVEDRHLYKWTSNTMVHLRGGKLADVRYRLLQKYFPELPDLYAKNSKRFRVSKEEVLSKGNGSVSEIVKKVEELSLKELESKAAKDESISLVLLSLKEKPYSKNSSKLFSRVLLGKANNSGHLSYTVFANSPYFSKSETFFINSIEAPAI